MAHVDSIRDRLPELYKEGKNLSRLLDVMALPLEEMDQEMRDIQRSHFFNQCVTLDDASKLGAILDIPVEDWQSFRDYRLWVHSLRDARLKAGAVTREGIRLFVHQYLEGFQRLKEVKLSPPATELSTTESDTIPSLIENPPVYRYMRPPGPNGLAPLDRFKVTNNGLDSAPINLVLTAFGSDAPEYAPMLMNVTTGNALVFLGAIPTGKRLWIWSEKKEDDSLSLHAELEGHTVTDKLKFIEGLVPGDANTAVQASGDPQPLMLERGTNEFWFMPLAHFDVPGLDRALLALADLNLKQGVWDETLFDHSLFSQQAAVALQMLWVESAPASFKVELPAQSMLSQAGNLEEGLSDRDRLESSLDEALRRLSAAGVESRVHMRSHREVQGARERLARVLPMTIKEKGSIGSDDLPDSGGAFGITDFDNSIFR
ncbi:MAG: hypothetical protein G3M70_05185 [Candidatus Nitronauta litoralis]|uniref:Uncharacterized protein n=1 Tax=Candidatus Nitronauta litoralis TaxID=2705533 RepID=A0A7T0BUQ5_9BACT|nr:MAG: hypothetical protein G3M70_05185 [Candidatus Nitronauta litoralis]